ncbi:hypothetical protein BDP55DRAFT_628107 [Colletotrichum godetiae]|uniref:Uncharacterized protein n=1 Tax=Colletotrichum godetiae TaxID=1209918 RepID=A0AAJ0AVN5_9PEZI|nr:uncharacterized protein BDP55DRAFT_628107 [Colletotrichum godetiae]KAK1690437.1 hypothetical protein BDP55DRAFT_628107 [Colletotrichum godetiae]
MDKRNPTPLTTVGCQPTKERVDDDVIYLGTYKGRQKSYQKTTTSTSTLEILAEMTYKHVKLGVMKDSSQPRRAVYGFFDPTSSMPTSVGYRAETKLNSDKGLVNFVQDDPLLVRFTEPFLTSGAFAFAKGFDGIVLPINVNAADQMSDHDRNHWILAIVNWKTERFDAFGMQSTAFSRWSKRVDEYVSELRGAVMQLEKRSHEVGLVCSVLDVSCFTLISQLGPHVEDSPEPETSGRNSRRLSQALHDKETGVGFDCQANSIPAGVLHQTAPDRMAQKGYRQRQSPLRQPNNWKQGGRRSYQTGERKTVREQPIEGFAGVVVGYAWREQSSTAQGLFHYPPPLSNSSNAKESCRIWYSKNAFGISKDYILFADSGNNPRQDCGSETD